MEINKIDKTDKIQFTNAIDLIWSTFLQFEAPDYSEEGTQSFKAFIDDTEYTVFNSSVSYIKQDGRLFQIAHVCRSEKDKKSDIQVSKELYINRCEIGYELPDNTKYEERGV